MRKLYVELSIKVVVFILASILIPNNSGSSVYNLPKQHFDNQQDFRQHRQADLHYQVQPMKINLIFDGLLSNPAKITTNDDVPYFYSSFIC